MSSASGLVDITSLHFPADLVDGAHDLLRGAGAEGYEGLVLFAGRRGPALRSTFEVVTAFAPAQILIRSEDGVGLRVEPAELLRINRMLYAKRLQLAAQVHSHPGAAYHSETDNAYSVVTVAGGLSLVVPNFASAAFRVATTAVYRLSVRGGWEEVSTPAAESLIQIAD